MANRKTNRETALTDMTPIAASECMIAEQPRTFAPIKKASLVRRTSKASSSEFWEKYKHPLWQKKRLEIMDRAQFKCEHCGTKDVTLNVHHSYYEKNKDPWDYPDESLYCFCERCHEEWHRQMTAIKQLIGRVGLANLDRLRGYLIGVAMQHELIESCSELNLAVADGIGDAYWLNNGAMIGAVLSGGTITAADLEKKSKSMCLERIKDKRRWKRERALRNAKESVETG